MKCPNCGAELSEDSVFCENCGHKLKEDAGFCPKCGRKFSSGDQYCENCGTRLSAGGAEEKLLPTIEPEKKPFPAAGKWLACMTAAALVLAVIGGAVFLFGGEEKEVSQTRLLYSQDDILYLADTADTEGAPLEITDFLTADDGDQKIFGLMPGNEISRDGSTVIYQEDYDGQVYDLYSGKLSGGKAVKIDSQVSSHQVLGNGTVLYVKRNSLYYFNGSDSVRFGRRIDADLFRTDEKEEYLFWAEADSGGGYAYYYQDLAGRQEKVLLDEGVTTLCPSGDLTGFIEVKYDNLYRVDNKGNKKRIAGNVARMISCDPESSAVYYLAESPRKVAYEDIIDEDVSMSEDDHAKLREMGRFELPYLELRYYDGSQDYRITDRYYPGSPAGPCRSENGRFCLYSEGPEPQEIRVKWSRFRGSLEDEDFGEQVLKQAAADGLFSCVKLAAGEKTIGEIRDEDGGARSCTYVYGEKTDTLYIREFHNDTKEGILYEVPLSGSGAGKRKELDGDVSEMGLSLAGQDGIYYIKDGDPNGGDLCRDGEIIDYDVFRMWQLDDGRLVYLADREPDGTGQGSYASLMMMDGGEKELILDDVSYADVARDGTIILLADYDFDRYEGELIYYDGAEKHVIAEDVAGFAPRRGSICVP